MHESEMALRMFMSAAKGSMGVDCVKEECIAFVNVAFMFEED